MNYICHSCRAVCTCCFLLTNNPKKVIGLDGYGLEICERVALEVPCNIYNSRYLETKRDKLGHLILTNGRQRPALEKADV